MQAMLYFYPASHDRGRWRYNLSGLTRDNRRKGMKGLALIFGSLVLFGCAQTSEREQAPAFGASVRQAIRLQTEFSGPQAFTTDGQKMLDALAAYRGKSGEGGLVQVDGYHRSDGTYVKPHVRTRPDGDPSNNLSAR